MANDTYYSNFVISVVKRHKCPQFKVTRLYIHDNLYRNIDTDTWKHKLYTYIITRILHNYVDNYI